MADILTRPQFETRWYTDATKVEAHPGDLILVATTGVLGKAIRLVTSGWCNHAAVVINVSNGQIMVSQETPRRGDVFSPLTELGATRIAVVSIEMDIPQRNQVIRFARWAKGKRYGFLGIAADLFNAITGLELDLGLFDRMTCSTATTRAAERSGWIPLKSPAAMAPIDIGRAFAAGKWVEP